MADPKIIPIYSAPPEWKSAQESRNLSNNLTTGPADGMGGNAVAGFFNHGDVVRPQQGFERQLQRQLSVLEDTTSLRQVLPTQVLGMVIENLSWVNTVLFPLNFTEELVTTVRRITVSVPFAPELPSLGIPRVLSRGSTSYSVRSVRYGMGLKFENIRLKTPEGKAEFILGLSQLGLVLKQNAAHDGLGALYNPDPEEKSYQEHYAIGSYEGFEEAKRREVDEFAAAHKDAIGLLRIHNKFVQLIRKRTGLVADITVCDKKLENFMKFDMPKLHEYWLAGPEGPRKLLRAEDSIGTFNGTSVYNPPEYKPELDVEGAPAMTDSTRRIGNFFVMQNKFLHMSASEYKTSIRNIMIHDESDRDDWAELVLEHMVENCGRWNEYGLPNDAHYHTAMAGHDDLFIYDAPETGGKRVARCFGQMMSENLSNATCHAVAESAAGGLSASQIDAIEAGVDLFEQALSTSGGFFSYKAIYEARNANTVALAFVNAWHALYRLLVARFGENYNPCLDPRKCPPWFAHIDAAEKGPLVLFETTVSHGVAVIAEKSVEVYEAGIVKTGFPTLKEDVTFNMSKAIEFLASQLAAYEATMSTDAQLNVEKNIEPISTFFNWLQSNNTEPAVNFARAIYHLATGQGPPGKYPNVRVVVTELLAFIKSTHQNLADDEILIYEFVESTGLDLRRTPGGASADENYVFLTPFDATIGNYFYLTPVSGFTQTAEWTPEVAAGYGKASMLMGSPDPYFYHEKGEPIKVVAAKRHRYDQPLELDKEEYHMNHESFPFGQAGFHQKYMEAKVQESLTHLKSARIAFLAAPIRLRVLQSMMRHNVQLPFDLIIWRPWMGYNMQSAWLAVGGAGTGNTNYGHIDVTVTVDGQAKSTVVAASWEIHTIVYEPKRIAAMPHISYNGILGGAGARCYDEVELANLKNAGWIVVEREAPSLISMLVRIGGAQPTHKDMDLRGTYEFEFPSKRPDHYHTRHYEEQSRGFSNLSNPYSARPDLWRGSIGSVNTVCYQGTQYACTTKPGAFSQHTTNTGHHGPIEYAGCAAIRRGVGGIYDVHRMPMVLGCS